MEKYYSQTEYKPKKWIFAVVLLAVAIVCTIFGFFFYTSINKYVFKENATFYDNGIVVDIQKNDKIVVNKKKNSISLKKSSGEVHPLSELPVYFKDENSILTICPMAYYRARQSSSIRGEQLEVFTKLSCQFGDTTISNGVKEKIEQGNFLFDGKDSYVVLRDCQLQIGDDIIYLSPLSYVICCYNSWVMYWNHDTNQFEYLIFDNQDKTDVNIYFEQDKTLVQCGLDRVSYGENSFMLSSAVTMLSKKL